MQVFSIRGLVRNTNYSVNALFIGPEAYAYQFAKVAYSEIERVLFLGKFIFCEIDPSHLPDAEVIVVNAKGPGSGKFLERARSDYLVLPGISFSLNLRGSVDEAIKKMSRRRRRDIKKLESRGYSYAISRNNEKHFAFFYWKMCLPYARMRFGRAALFSNYSILKAYYKNNGGIIFVRKEKRPIAGLLFHIKENTLYALRFGVYNGNRNFVRDLAGQAALLFLIKWAKAQGLKSLNYGRTTPFFRDSLFTYKKEWGMLLEEDPDQPFFALNLNSQDERALSFLQQNPCIFLHYGVMKGVVMLNTRPTKDELQRIFSEYFLPKLCSLIVIAYYSPKKCPLNKIEFLPASKKFPDVTKPLLSICLPLQKRGYIVDAYEITTNRIVRLRLC